MSQFVSHFDLLNTFAAPFGEVERRMRSEINFFVSQQGRIGWVPFAHPGWRSTLCLPWDEGSYGRKTAGWSIGDLGPFYVHGLMDGEVWDLDGLWWDFLSFVWAEWPQWMLNWKRTAWAWGWVWVKELLQHLLRFFASVLELLFTNCRSSISSMISASWYPTHKRI
jgi:hypothetical protein